MAIEFARRLLGIGSAELQSPRRVRKDTTINPEVGEMFTAALEVEAGGDEALAKSMWINAATRARAFYGSYPEGELDTVDISIRSQYAQLALNGLANAHEIDEAMDLAGTLLEDPRISGSAKTRIQKMVEMNFS